MIVVALLVLIPAATFIVVQIPSVQNSICRKVTEKLGGSINGSITVGKVYIVYLNHVLIDDAALVTADGDTAAAVGRISVTVPPAFWKNGEIRISGVTLKNGYAKYAADSSGKSNFASIFSTKAKLSADSTSAKTRSAASGDSSSKKSCISLNSLHLKNFKVIYDKWDVDSIYITVKDIRYCNDTASCRIAEGRAKEKGGIVLNELKAELAYTPTSVELRDFTINDGHSDIKIDSLTVRGSDKDYLKDFRQKARMQLHISESRLSAASAAPFVKSLEGNDIQAFLACDAEGTFDNLHLDRLKIFTPAGGTALNATASFIGLSDPATALAHIDVTDCSTSMRDIAAILRKAGDAATASAVSKYAPGETFHFKGSLDGFFDDFVAYGSLYGNRVGKVLLDLQMQNDKAAGVTRLNGHANTVGLDLGEILQSKSLGKLTLESKLNGALNRDDSRKSIIRLDKLSISELGLLGYNYSSINAAGELKGDEFTGRLACSDPNLNFLFEGIITLGGKKENSLYRFAANIGYANLTALNLDKKEGSEIRLSTEANFTQTASGDAFGTIDVKGLHLKDVGKDRNIGDIHVKSYSGESGYNLTLKSRFAEADYRGSAAVSRFIGDLKRIVAREIPNLFSGEEGKSLHVPAGRSYRLTFETYDTRDLLTFLAPGLYIDDSTKIKLEMTPDDIVTASVNSSLISYQKNFLKNLRLDFDNRDSMLTCVVKDDLLLSGDIPVHDNIITLRADDNTAEANIKFSNSGEYGNSADISAKAYILEKGKNPFDYIIALLPSRFSLQGKKWRVERSTVSINSKKISVGNLLVHSEAQQIRIGGVVSDSPDDSVTLKLDNLDLSLANTVLKGKPFKLGGKLSGKATAYSLLGTPKAIIDFNGKDIKADDELFGDLIFKTEWEADKNDFNVTLRTRIEDRYPVSVAGTFRPADKQIDMGVELDKFDIGIVAPLAESVFSQLGGSLSGTVRAEGPLDKLKINSEGLGTDSLLLKVAWTNVPYVVKGPITIKDNYLTFDNMSLRDEYGNTGTVGGGINLGDFSNIMFDTRIDVRDALGVNNNAKISPAFYAKLFASGTVRITGPMDKLVLDIRARTGDNSTMHIPLGGASAQSQSLLTFIDSSKVAGRTNAFDSLLQSSKESAKPASSLAVKVNGTANTGALVLLEINSETGDALRIRGRGNVQIDLDESKELFDIKGDYTVQEGSYRLSLANVATRDFTIDEGGTIHFGGDIMQSDLDLTAKYRTKAAIGTLIGDTSSVNTRRNVNCCIDRKSVV